MDPHIAPVHLKNTYSTVVHFAVLTAHPQRIALLGARPPSHPPRNTLAFSDLKGGERPRLSESTFWGITAAHRVRRGERGREVAHSGA